MRSPYPGICNQMFPRISNLIGLDPNADFRKWALLAVGGPEGCVHLADLIADLARYQDGLANV